MFMEDVQKNYGYFSLLATKMSSRWCVGFDKNNHTGCGNTPVNHASTIS
jgi:hypothetical protein